MKLPVFLLASAASSFFLASQPSNALPGDTDGAASAAAAARPTAAQPADAPDDYEALVQIFDAADLLRPALPIVLGLVTLVPTSVDNIVAGLHQNERFTESSKKLEKAILLLTPYLQKLWNFTQAKDPKEKKGLSLFDITTFEYLQYSIDSTIPPKEKQEKCDSLRKYLENEQKIKEDRTLDLGIKKSKLRVLCQMREVWVRTEKKLNELEALRQELREAAEESLRKKKTPEGGR